MFLLPVLLSAQSITANAPFYQPVKVAARQTNNYVVSGSAFTTTANTNFGTPPYTYQTYLNGTAIAGATSATYTKTASTSNDQESYYTVATDANGIQDTANTVVLHVVAPLTALTLPDKYAVQVETNLFVAPFTGGVPPFTYSWLLNNASVISTAAKFMYGGQPADSGRLIKVTITDATGASVTTNNCKQYITTFMTAQFIDNATITAGNTTTYTAKALNGGFAPFTYGFYINNALIQMGSSTTFTTGLAGRIMYSITDSKGYTIYSDVATIFVN